MADEELCPEERAMLEDVRHDARPGPKRVYADWLEEHGRRIDAHAYRWAAARNLHPHVSGVRGYATWRLQGFGRRHHSLPSTLMDLMDAGPGRAVQFESVAAAFEALAEALEALRQLWEVEPS